MSNLLFQPALPWPWLILAALGIFAAIIFTLRRGIHSPVRAWTLAALRLLALLALCVMLFQPQRREDDVVVLRPQIAVLIDDSQSMRDKADAKQPLRMERVHDLLASPGIVRAQKDFDVRTFSFGKGLVEGAPDVLKYDAGASDIGGALAQIEDRFRGQPLAAVLLLTDGLDTGGVAVSSTIPIDTFELEKPFTAAHTTARLSLANVDYPPRIVAGWDTQIRASIAARGMAGRTAAVELWRDGRKQSETALPFNSDDQTREVSFPISEDQPGSIAYELRVNDPAADKDARSHPFVIQVLASGNRVLYLQNALGFDFKFLRRAILSDRNLQLAAYVRMAGGQLVNLAGPGSPALPLDLSPQGLSSEAVVILGDLPPGALSAEQSSALRDFVDHGGGLVLLGGPNSLADPMFASGPLAPLLPVKVPAQYVEGSFPLEITDAGLHHPVFGSLFAQVRQFPALLTCNVPASVTPDAEVLMTANVNGVPAPVIVSRRFGQGRVVAVMTDTIWRWRLAARGWSSAQSPYDIFWTQLMDWLIPKENNDNSSGRLDLFTERSLYAPGEHPEVRAIFHGPAADRPAILPLRVRTPDGKTFDYQMKAATLQTTSGQQVPGWRVQVDPTAPGVYRATAQIGAAIQGQARFVVSQPATEITGKAIDRDFLQGVATASGGHFYSIDHWDAWAGDLHVREQHFSRVRLADLWNHPAVLAFFMMALSLDWALRKLWNLP
jgi:hypothetical protein